MNTKFSVIGCMMSLMVCGFAASANADGAPAKPDSNACVFFNSVSDWKALDDRNLVIWAPGRNNPYLLTFSMPLLGLRSANNLAFIDHNRDGRVCSHGMDAVAINDRALPQKSTISTMTRLDADAVAKLEEQYKIKLAYGSRKKTVPQDPSRDAAQ